MYRLRMLVSDRFISVGHCYTVQSLFNEHYINQKTSTINIHWKQVAEVFKYCLQQSVIVVEKKFSSSLLGNLVERSTDYWLRSGVHPKRCALSGCHTSLHSFTTLIDRYNEASSLRHNLAALSAAQWAAENTSSFVDNAIALSWLCAARLEAAERHRLARAVDA